MALRLAFSPTFTVISAAPVIAALFLSHGFAGSVSVGSHPVYDLVKSIRHPALGLFTGILILSGFPSGPGLAASS